MLKLDQNTVCPLAACPQCSQCLRYKNYLQVRNKEVSMTVVNTELVTPTSEGCPYLLVRKSQRIAYGFERLRNEVPRKHLSILPTLMGFGSRASFERRWHDYDKFGLSPSEQQHALEVFSSLGVDTSIGFDRYREEEVVVEPNK